MNERKQLNERKQFWNVVAAMEKFVNKCDAMSYDEFMQLPEQVREDYDRLVDFVHDTDFDSLDEAMGNMDVWANDEN